MDLSLNKEINIEDRHISNSLMEKILSVKNNSLVPLFFLIYKRRADGKGIKNVTINKKGEMTFLPKGKESVVSTETFPNVWKPDNRQSGSYGKVLRKLLIENDVEPNYINASHLEEIVNALKAFYTVQGTFELVSGSDIPFYYLEDNYDPTFNNGTMASSCMRYEGVCETAAEFYAEADNCEMLILKSPDGETSRGRALVWTDSEGTKWMDRIYANDHITKAFKQYAHNNDMAHKASQSACRENWVFPNGEVKDINVTIQVGSAAYQRIMPYMDTFYHVSFDRGTVSTGDRDYDICAQTEPDQQEDTVYDEIDDCYISEDDAIWLEYRDIYTHCDNATYCDYSHEYYANDDVVRLSSGDWAYKELEDIFYIESEGEWYHIDEISLCEHTEEDYPSHKVTFIDDLGINVHEDYIDEAYEAAGWVQDADGDWVEELETEEEEA